VRYGETDQMGLVYHANYFVYFELGRTELIRSRGVSYADLEAQGTRLPVLEAHARFHAAARYDDELLVETRLTDASAVRLRFEYAVRRAADGALLATGHTVLASVGPDGRPRRLPPAVRAAFVGRAP
jgi:acyl-CoA thioester hydrolase